LYAAVDALESILIDKAERDATYLKFIKLFREEVNGMLAVANKSQNDVAGFKLYEKIKMKYRELLKLAYKEHVEDPTSDDL